MTKVRPPSRSTSRESETAVDMPMMQQWKPVFDKYDTDKDGWIPLTDLKRLLQTTNKELSDDFPAEVLDEVLERADWDHDGRISYEEFLRMVRARELGASRPKFQLLVRYAAVAVVPQSQRATTIRRYLDEYNCMLPPVFLLVISLLEVAVFIYYCVTLKELTASGPVPITSPLIYNPFRRWQAWRYLSYMFIHAGGVHIFFNLLIQLALGVPLEMVHKWWRVGLVYLAGVLAGSLGASLSDPKTYLAGASGGVYALIAAHLANVIINFKEMAFAWFRLIALFVIGGVDVGVALYSRYYVQEENRTSYAAHFAGALAGLLVGVNCLRNLRVHSWENKLGWVMLAIYIILMLFAILWNALNTDYFPKQEFDK